MNAISKLAPTETPVPRHRLPAELNHEIYLCFKLATQRKFICGLGWEFYAMFRHKLLTQSKRLRNPAGNKWNRNNTRGTISPDGLYASTDTEGNKNVFAEKAFPISRQLSRCDAFPGTICFYYEVKNLMVGELHDVGLSDGTIMDNAPWMRSGNPNLFAINYSDNLWSDWSSCLIAGKKHRFEWPLGAIRPQPDEHGVYGCGLLMDPKDNLLIFFTLNGILIGRQIPITPSADQLFPYVTMSSMGEYDVVSLVANFGDNPAKPFVYDIKMCPGMGLEWA